MLIRPAVGKWLQAWIVVVCGLGGLAGAAHAQTAAEVQRRFADLRDDNIPHNGTVAALWLYQRRDQLKDSMLDELYRTDRQGRDALLQILFKTPSLVPDERFERFVVNRLPEEDRLVGNLTFAMGDAEFNDAGGAGAFLNGLNGAHWAAFQYMDEHFEAFDPLLAAQVGAKKSLWALWGTTWLFKKRGVLEQHAALYTPDVLAWMAGNLRDDKVRYNASHAARTFILLGDHGLPTLRQTAASGDPQARSLARALIDALNGNHRAFGYLEAKTTLSKPVFGQPRSAPAWLEAAAQPFYETDTNYP